MELKNLFIDGCKQLQTIVYNKLQEHEIYNTDVYRNRIKRELDEIREQDLSAYMLFLYDFVNKLKENGIGYSPRGIHYTSLFISYLLGIIEFNPLSFDLDIVSSKRNIIELDTDGSPEIICKILAQYDKNRIFRKAFRCQDLSYETNEYQFLITEKPLCPDFNAAVIDAVKKDTFCEKDTGNHIEIFIPYQLMVKKIKMLEAKIGIVDYGDFNDKKVYEYIGSHSLPYPSALSFKRIQAEKPTNLLSLAKCPHMPNDPIPTKSQLAHWLCEAIKYYKIAYLKCFYLDS